MGKYTVMWGDTLSGIAAKNKTTVDKLSLVNNISDPNRIFAGQVIDIPEDSSGGNDAAGTGADSTEEKKETAPAFTYNPFTTSEEYNKAAEKLGGLKATDALDPTYWASVQAAQDKINNREKFSYDLNGDALYQQYKDKYIQQGKMAMQDTMGQAAALTGGYGNSYAATAGNQAYQAHLQNLNDVVPELWQMAYDRYNQEGQDLLNQYSMAKDAYTTKYGEKMDEIAQYNSDRSYLQAVADSLWQRDYGAWNDNRTFEYGQHRDSISDEQWKAAMEYQKERDGVSDQQWQKEFDVKYGKPNQTTTPNKTPTTTEKTPNKTPTTTKVDPNGTAIKDFKSKLHSESSHDAVARAMYGSYKTYIAIEIAKSTNLNDSEKIYLIQLYGITNDDIEAARVKGWDL